MDYTHEVTQAGIIIDSLHHIPVTALPLGITIMDYTHEVALQVGVAIDSLHQVPATALLLETTIAGSLILPQLLIVMVAPRVQMSSS